MRSATEAALLDAAERRYISLLERGVSERDARERTWACYERAYNENNTDIPTKDATFMAELQSIIEKGF